MDNKDILRNIFSNLCEFDYNLSLEKLGLHMKDDLELFQKILIKINDKVNELLKDIKENL